MIQTALASFLTASIISLSTVSAVPVPFGYAQDKSQAQVELGSASMSLDNRLTVKSANDVYKDNILLNLAYFSGEVRSKEDINWDQIRKPFTLQISLESGQRFAYHDSILDKYNNNLVFVGNTHFNASEGYKTDGNLFGMGVCHLASLMHRAALNAGLDSIAPSNHDFYAINEIPREYGVAIYSNPESKGSSANQNLYITNNLGSKITYKLEFDGVNLKASVLKY